MIPSFPSHFAKLVNKRTKEQFFFVLPATIPFIAASV